MIDLQTHSSHREHLQLSFPGRTHLLDSSLSSVSETSVSSPLNTNMGDLDIDMSGMQAASMAAAGAASGIGAENKKNGGNDATSSKKGNSTEGRNGDKTVSECKLLTQTGKINEMHIRSNLKLVVVEKIRESPKEKRGFLSSYIG